MNRLTWLWRSFWSNRTKAVKRKEQLLIWGAGKYGQTVAEILSDLGI